MKISIPIKCDSDNSYPKEDLELTVTGMMEERLITLQLSNSNRTIGVRKSDIVKAIQVLD